MLEYKANTRHRVRTLTGKEIELDIEADYKVRLSGLRPPYADSKSAYRPSPTPQTIRQAHSQRSMIAMQQQEPRLTDSRSPG
jgi:hypothetical protein